MEEIDINLNLHVEEIQVYVLKFKGNQFKNVNINIFSKPQDKWESNSET